MDELNEIKNVGRRPLKYWKNQDPPKNNEIFTDPLFPPNNNSLLGLDSSGNPIDKVVYEQKAGRINTDEIGFFRPNEIFESNYCLFSDILELEDIKQGGLGDCYFITAIANLCKFPNKLKKLFKQTLKNDLGFYEIILFIDGKRQVVIVDDYLPAYKKSKKLCFAKSTKNQIWVALLEKAWAKINGGYINIIAGNVKEGLEFLTGRGSLCYYLSGKKGEALEDYKLEVIKNVQLADENNCLISCSTSGSFETENKGLVSGHAYSLLNFTKIETSDGKDVYLFRIRNPWSYGEWTGDWSDKSELWDSNTKNQVHFEDKDDGVFFMSEIDFFKYFDSVEICFLFFDSKEVIFEIEDEEILRNASVFNVETEEDGYLSVFVPKENWRTNRAIKDKALPTHIAVAKYNPEAKDRLKTFTNYNGVCGSALNLRILKGNYLIYVYRDFDHATYEAERKLTVKITCSANFKYAQMSYDMRERGFPLLQNIILQECFRQDNYDPESGQDYFAYRDRTKGNQIGVFIKYISTPGYFYKCNADTVKLDNYVLLSPYLDSNTTTFSKIVPSGQYLVLMGMWTGIPGSNYDFELSITSRKVNEELIPNYETNDINLISYIDFNSDVKDSNFKERKTLSLERVQKDFFKDENYGKVQYMPLDELQIKYGKYIQLLDDIKLKKVNGNLKWSIKKQNTRFI